MPDTQNMNLSLIIEKIKSFFFDIIFFKNKNKKMLNCQNRQYCFTFDIKYFNLEFKIVNLAESRQSGSLSSLSWLNGKKVTNKTWMHKVLRSIPIKYKIIKFPLN